MNQYTLVRPEHLNHFGHLFGGQMLKWVDEYAALAAMRDYPACWLVTKAMDQVVFSSGVDCGAMLRFQIRRERVGTTSVTYRVDVFGKEMNATDEHHVFETSITFVRLDDDGIKYPLPTDVQSRDSDEDDG
ncbi:MAG: acyl-CoA thioesterase [Lentisphaeria bacterium]|nr:acyl-CoA thioesterase [Lentisphaeria bacterium]